MATSPHVSQSQVPLPTCTWSICPSVTAMGGRRNRKPNADMGVYVPSVLVSSEGVAVGMLVFGWGLAVTMLAGSR